MGAGRGGGAWRRGVGDVRSGGLSVDDALVGEAALAAIEALVSHQVRQDDLVTL